MLAMASGTVKEVRQSITAGGVHARGLFEWNSVSVCGACFCAVFSPTYFPPFLTLLLFCGLASSKANVYRYDTKTISHRVRCRIDSFCHPIARFPKIGGWHFFLSATQTTAKAAPVSKIIQ